MGHRTLVKQNNLRNGKTTNCRVCRMSQSAAALCERRRLVKALYL